MPNRKVDTDRQIDFELYDLKITVIVKGPKQQQRAFEKDFLSQIPGRKQSNYKSKNV